MVPALSDRGLYYRADGKTAVKEPREDDDCMVYWAKLRVFSKRFVSYRADPSEPGKVVLDWISSYIYDYLFGVSLFSIDLILQRRF